MQSTTPGSTLEDTFALASGLIADASSGLFGCLCTLRVCPTGRRATHRRGQLFTSSILSYRALPF
jgi:hypothetical protein